MKNTTNFISFLFLIIDCRVENPDVIFSKRIYRHGEKVYFTCNNQNTSSLNNETIHCINGHLSKQPNCPQNIIACTVPHTLFLRNIANTTLPSGTTFPVGSSFSYTCNQDYQPSNQSTVVECLENGKLSQHAHCVPISCKEHPPMIENGRTVYHSNTHGSIARYKCFPGYKFENNSLIKLTCQFGVWLPQQLPKCLPSNENVFFLHYFCFNFLYEIKL